MLPSCRIKQQAQQRQADCHSVWTQVALHHGTRAVMHLLRPCLSSRVEAHVDAWASRLAGCQSLRQAHLDRDATQADQPWLVLEQLTKQLWQLHCRKQLGIAVSVLQSQVRATWLQRQWAGLACMRTS